MPKEWARTVVVLVAIALMVIRVPRSASRALTGVLTGKGDSRYD